MKHNFIDNTFNKIDTRCSTEENRQTKRGEFEQLLVENGYGKRQIRYFKQRNEKRKRKETRKLEKNGVPLFLQFVSDSTNKKIKNIIKKYDLNVHLVSKPAPQLGQILRRKEKKSEDHECGICEAVKKTSACKTRYVVYKFVCRYCRKFYIGQTSRPFFLRYNEHKWSIRNKNDHSALSEHLLIEHNGASENITDFDVQFIEICRNPIECKIREAKYIECLRPDLNRRHEMTHW